MSDERRIDIVPFREGDLPPPGCVLVHVRDESTGATITGWAKVADLTPPAGPGKPLTKAQRERAAWQWERIRKYVKHADSLASYVAVFERDREPEVDLRLWDSLVHVFDSERKDRPASEHRLLWLALIHLASGQATADSLLARCAKLKGLPRLEAVVTRFVADRVRRADWLCSACGVVFVDEQVAKKEGGAARACPTCGGPLQPGGARP